MKLFFQTYCRCDSSLPLRLFAAIGAVFAAASVSLQSSVHRWVQFGVDGLFVRLNRSWEGAFSIRQRGAAPLAPCAAHTPRCPGVVSLCAPSGPLDFSASPHGLELGKGHYICPLGSVPDCAAAGGVVVVEATTLLVKELPPLVTVGLADRDTRRGIPAALASGQIHIHVLSGAWLQDLHPIRAE